ncbi:MAG: transcriptional regulator MraZ [Actinomycetota bacterium]|nr:transcriptional regulator MraZ [Actinomycetota bacterium]
MFLGQFEHALDQKGRVILPVKFREQLESGAYLAASLDGCVAVYQAEEFERVMSDMTEMAKRGQRERQAARAFAAKASPAAIDKQGRMLVPGHLRTFASLERDVVITGNVNRVEIWDAGRWQEVDREGGSSLVAGGPGLDEFGI